MSEIQKVLEQAESAAVNEVREPPKPRYAIYRHGGYKFVFKYDLQSPDMLHIWVRHTKTPEQAIEIWFEGATETWNQEEERFETYTDTEYVYWFWLKPDEDVMIISCGTRRDINA